jgi:hypothetical protein
MAHFSHFSLKNILNELNDAHRKLHDLALKLLLETDLEVSFCQNHKNMFI